MITLGRVIQLALMLLLILASIFVLASIAGFWGDKYMIISAVIVIVTWGLLFGLMIRALNLARWLGYEGGDFEQTWTWTSRLVLLVAIHAVVTGLELAFLAFVGCGCYWLPSLYHWLGLITAVLAFLMYYLFPWTIRTTVEGGGGEHGEPFKLWTKILFPLLVAIIWLLAWLIPYFLLKGSINENEYKATVTPAPVYKLPFPGGESSWVIQGNNSSLNHQIKTKADGTKSDQKYAWDFRRPCGTPILAARGGVIASDPIKKNDGIGGDNNEIDVDHGDGTIGVYMHFQQNSTKLKKGDKVNAGDELAKVGSVGNSLTGHIHFMVKEGGKTKAIKFQDVRDDGGIPRTFSSYTSGNKKL